MKYLPKNKRGFTPSGAEGQALLLVLLSMAVVLTVVLSILSRSVTDIKVTSADEASLRAFSAAEAGIEQAMVTGSSATDPIIGFTATVTGISAGTTEYIVPSNLSAGESATVWFVSHGSDGNLVCNFSNPCFTGDKIQVCWGKDKTYPDPILKPALEVSVFYKEPDRDYSTAKIARDFFPAPGAGTCQINGFAFSKTLSLKSLIPSSICVRENGLQFAIIRILYNTDMAQPVGVNVNFAGNSTLPAQGIKINSQGVSGSANRGVEVYQGYPEPPLIFGSAVFSEGGITQ